MSQALLITKHHKLEHIAPAFHELGWTLHSADIDTDVLGTFSGDIARTASPLLTARRKALLGSGLGEEPWLMASEGTITPSMLALPLDRELVVAVDRMTLTTVTGHAARFATVACHFVVEYRTSEEEVITKCAAADLPGHRLLISTPDRSLSAIGGLESVEAVLKIITKFRRRGRKLVVQTDFRAHLCPSRQVVIAAAAQDLADRLSHRCPRCSGAGFGCEEVLLGLLCANCGQPTEEIASEQWRCPWCSFSEARRREKAADPQQCGHCNP